MAKKKTTAKSTKESAKSKKQASFMNFGESYTSLVLGIVVVIIASILLVSFVRNRNDVQPIPTDKPDISATSIGPAEEGSGSSEHTVRAGQGLWQIAEERYGSGYNWVDIAEANNITDPNQIVEGAVLVLPDVEPKERTSEDPQPTATATPSVIPVQEVAQTTPTPQASPTPQAQERERQIQTTSYTVVAGDTLWSIAERKYGDGFRFMRISQDNRIQNPDLIYVGQVIGLPDLPNAPNSN